MRILYARLYVSELHLEDRYSKMGHLLLRNYQKNQFPSISHDKLTQSQYMYRTTQPRKNKTFVYVYNMKKLHRFVV